jgi:hypothetical protein
MTPTDWKKNGALRAEWTRFKANPAFKAGIDLCRYLNRPFISMHGDAVATLATRQAFQAGFEAALRSVESLDTLQTNSTQQEVGIPEWDYVPAQQHPLD